MNKKIVLATGVEANETNVQRTATAGNEASTVTTAGSGRIGTEKNETTQVDKQPTSGNTNAETGSQSNDSNQSGVATNDDDI